MSKAIKLRYGIRDLQEIGYCSSRPPRLFKLLPHIRALECFRSCQKWSMKRDDSLSGLMSLWGV